LRHFNKIILAFSVLFALVQPKVNAEYAVGDIIGDVLSTDIVTYINDTEVASFNINGRTAIVAQDLSCFGFSVQFSEEQRTLTIKKGNTAGGYLAEAVKSSGAVGEKVGNVYFTDIVTYCDDTWIQSFNIGGLTSVFADDVAALLGAGFEWNETERTVRVTTKGYKPVIKKISSVRSLDAGSTYAEREFSLRRWGKAKNSHITVNPDGGYTVVEIGEHVNIEKYDASFNLTESYAIKRELPIFGTLYFGKDYNYIAFGQDNFSEDNSREIIKIVIYDKSFVKISEVPIFNCKTTVPFDAASAEISEDDNFLVLHASRSQYAEENGSRPQTQLTIVINKADWSLNNMLGKYQPNHTSHSLRQHVRVANDKITTLDLCDTAPYRGVVLSVLDFKGNPEKVQSIFNAGGPLGANCTGIMTGGLEVTKTGCLAVINSIDHSLPTGYDSVSISGIENEERDIYLIALNGETGEIMHNCLARYTGLNKTGSVPKLVKVDEETYAVLWQEYDNSEALVTEAIVSCVLADGSGKLISDTVKIPNALLSDSCTPVINGNSLVWYVNTDAGRDFYSVDLSAVKGVEADFSEEVPKAEEIKVNEPEKNVDEIKSEEISEKVNKEEKPRKEILEVDGI